MSATLQEPRRTVLARLSEGGWEVALLLVVGLATVGAAISGRAAIAAAPVLIVACLVVLLRAPLRWSTAALIFLLLAVDTSMVEGACPHGLTCRWRTPFVFLGDLLHGPLPGVPVTGMEVLVVLLLGIWAHRRAGGSAIDTRGAVASPRVLRGLSLLFVAAVLFSDVYGLARGGELALWKLRNLLHPIALFALFEVAFRGPLDHRLVGRVIVLSATIRAALAVVIQMVARAQSGGTLESGTSHGDSVLFTVGVFLLLADLLERPTRRKLVRALVLLPVLLLGISENDRRLAWVMLAAMLAVAYLVSPMTRWRRALTRVVAVGLPVITLYLAVGWNRDSLVFRPVRTFRSVIDTSVDHSAYWREVENWNIVESMRAGPLLGAGLGRYYTEHMQNDDITGDYEEYRRWPHNTVLGLLFLMGLLPFTATWMLYAAATFLAARAYRMATRPEDRAAALSCLAAMVACHLLAWGDTGAHYPQYKVILALVLAASGKLAVATGAWPVGTSSGLAKATEEQAA